MLDLVHRQGKEYPEEDWGGTNYIDLCDNLPLWDLRVVDTSDDHRFDYKDAAADDDGRFDYPEEGKPYSAHALDIDGGEEPVSESGEDYDLNTMTDPDDPGLDSNLVDVEGGDEDEPNPDDGEYCYRDEDTGEESDIALDVDGGENTDVYTEDLDFNIISKNNIVHTEDYDFNQMIYTIPEEYVNIAAMTVWQIARTMQDQLIEITADYRVQQKVYKGIQPCAMSTIKIHMGINPKMNKIYVEWLYNKEMNFVLGDKRNYVNMMVTRFLRNYFLMTFRWHHATIEVTMPEDDKNIINDTTYLVTPYTIGYWKSFYGKYAFLEDRNMVKQDMLPLEIVAKRNQSRFDRSYFHNAILKINKDYNMNETSHNRIPEVMQVYKALYEETFDTKLPEIYELNAYIGYQYDLYGVNRNNVEVVVA